MKEFTTNYLVLTTADKIEFEKPLEDVNGNVRYLFVCRGGSDNYLDKISSEKNINYVGPLGCRLIEGNQELEYSLLAEDESAPWYTRGQYHNFEEVIGVCGNYPEYGQVRHFRLRGFELTLTAVDPVVNKQNKVQSFTMKVSLRKDEKIKSQNAEEPGYISPYQEGMSCKTVIKGNIAGMCRNWEKGGSWEKCKK